MLKTIAHTISDKERTMDVTMQEQILPFSKMLISDQTLQGLKKNGFVSPSPIQIKAIPLGINSLDLIIQAKSGTGKTLVFSIIILEALDNTKQAPQSLIIVPTREIAVQIEEVLSAVSCAFVGFKVRSFIGGLDVTDDRKKIQNCKAIVGTPGRIVHLIRNNILNVNEIKLLVLDEADKLLQSSFLSDINLIYASLKNRQQMIVASATYDNNLENILASYMKNPVKVTPKREAPILLGVKQFIYEIAEQQNNIKEMLAKVEELKKIFAKIDFKQCLIFSSSQSRAESYCNYLVKEGWPCEVITGAQDQKTRLNILRKLKEFKCRILSSTDLISRGIDAENVNLIINLEVPMDGSIYLHRIGRAGRFGSHGIAITFVNSGREILKFKKILNCIGGAEMSVLKFSLEKMSDIWNFHNGEEEKLKYGEFFAGSESDENKTDKDDSSKSPDNSEKNSVLVNNLVRHETQKTNDILSNNERLLQIASTLIDKKSNDETILMNVFENYDLGMSNLLCDTPNYNDIDETNSVKDKTLQSDAIQIMLKNLKEPKLPNDNQENSKLTSSISSKESKTSRMLSKETLFKIPKIDSESETDSKSQAASETETDFESETDSKSEATSETETDSEIEADSETERDSESEIGSTNESEVIQLNNKKLFNPGNSYHNWNKQYIDQLSIIHNHIALCRKAMSLTLSKNH